MPQTLNADYKVIVLSGNAFLWLGLKTFISQSVDPCPEIFWINDVSPEGILPLRQLMLNIRVKKGWLVFTDASRVNDIKIILGGSVSTWWRETCHSRSSAAVFRTRRSQA
ncbi:hypothetical protein [Enterobacter ludwigii]|uniref:hypothetical protein n=1 Tax=Enterobacter ludwigii TaxID=299767 RepID=UPI002A18E4BC|nr:hypothetical protein [Enterobacter ludwigii]